MGYKSIGMAALAATVLACQPAAADWLQCAASADSPQGPTGFYTTIVDVGAAPPERLASLQQRLSSYVTHYDPALTAVQAKCAAFADQATAASHYSHLLDGEYRLLGWGNVVVVQASDWLPAQDIATDPEQP